MGKRRSAPKQTNASRETQLQHGEIWWKRILIALLAATASVGLMAYQSNLTHIVEPWISDAFGWAEDHIRPMPDDKLIGISLRFWQPSDTDRGELFEGLSITIGPKQCRQPGGYELTRIFNDHDSNAYTHAFVHVTCRASGRVIVTLVPRDGAATNVYDGLAKEWVQLPFPGVKGSYSYGDVVVTTLNRDPPAGPWIPANKCQLTNSCAAELAADLGASSLPSEKNN
ncbi:MULTISPECIES: hypothetical protein [Burkholderia cepacia complex]|uniref:hypothetical protein n=1 Tax=Burkholderia cepacia complex TaxID=87882 RepID=UPI000B1FE86C|nr:MULTISPECIES: hypothetical protein [Burkholderia cepacia complex]MDN7899074.1 hypothetical protein [Burkholderia cepacia]